MLLFFPLLQAIHCKLLITHLTFQVFSFSILLFDEILPIEKKNVLHLCFLLKEFFICSPSVFFLNGDLSLGRCAKYGYKPNMKYKSLFISSFIFFLHTLNQIWKYGKFCHFFAPSFLAIENLQNDLIFKSLIFISLFGEFHQLKKKKVVVYLCFFF